MGGNRLCSKLSRGMLTALVFSMVLFFSCKKAIQQQEENIIINAVTDGHWFVKQYKKDSLDVTAMFTGYEFQFYKNNNVDALLNATKKSGTWNSDISNYTITATFPANAGDTLVLLNHTWKITDSYLNYVECNTPTATGTNYLHLRKK